jgi:REP element-mobilizing transposase RayT
MPDGGPRIQGFSYRGLYRYSLTVCVHSRRKVFDNAELVAEVLNEIQGAADIERFEVLTCCFMPDHVHLLIEGKTDDAGLTQAIGEYPYAGWCQEWVDFPKPGPEA